MNAYYYADIILKRSINKLFTNIIIDKKHKIVICETDRKIILENSKQS